MVDSSAVPAGRWQRSLRSGTSSMVGVAPGLALCAISAAAAISASRLVPGLNPLAVSIVLGASLTNTIGISETMHGGLAFSAKSLLRMGVALLGLQLVVGDLLALGSGVMFAVLAIVVLGIVSTLVVGGMLSLSWSQRILIACGFSICGAAAVAAANTVLEPDEDETATAVALVVIFGTGMIVVIPALSHAFGFTQFQAGLWAGGSIHEVAQVVAAAGTIGGAALAVAVIVKLARVVLLAPVIAVISIAVRYRSRRSQVTSTRSPMVPLFVVAFVACVALRSSGAVPEGAVSIAAPVQTFLLSTAMFALGAGVKIATLRSVGIKPVLLGAVSTACVTVVSLCAVLLMT